MDIDSDNDSGSDRACSTGYNEAMRCNGGRRGGRRGGRFDSLNMMGE